MSYIEINAQRLFELFDQDFNKSQLKAVMDDIDMNYQTVESMIAGGAVVRSLLGIDLFKGDIDIFPLTVKGLDYWTTRFSTDKTWRKAKHAYDVDYKQGLRQSKIQIITREKEPERLVATLDKFDFEHCKFGAICSSVTAKNYSVFTTEAALVMLAKRELKLGYIREPNYSMGRAIKYQRLGFKADKALEQLAALSIKNAKDIQLSSSISTTSSIDFCDVDTVIASMSS